MCYMRIVALVCAVLIVTSGCKHSQQFVSSVSLVSHKWIEHTVWKLSYNHREWGNRTFEVFFGDNGRLVCFNLYDTTPYNDEWELHDDKIILYFNNRDAVYEAVVFDDEVLVGTAHSYIGGTWNWIAQRYK